jgi:hypothetical protein
MHMALMLGILLLSAHFGLAQGLLECANVRFEGPECTESLPPQLVAPGPLAPSLAPQPPLFSPETVARDTPPLMLDLLNNPTPTNAQAWYHWHMERWKHIAEVQRLLRQLSTPRPQGGE